MVYWLICKIFYFGNNPIEYIPPNVQRLLNRRKHGQNIYNDKQSVHNHSIQESFRKSVSNLLSIKPSIKYEDIIEDLIANNFDATSNIIEFSSDESIHGELNLTFKELLICVYNRIIKNEHKLEILKILSEEMKSAECKCFTGRITRLVSCLVGFEDDIIIKISDNEQIGNVLSILRKKYNNDDEKFNKKNIKQFF